MRLDKELLRRARNGEEVAFEALVRKYQNLVYTLALRMLANPEDALDVSQDVFVRVWRSLSKFEGRSEFTTWLYRITANTCLDYVKRRKRDRHDSLSLHEAENAEFSAFNYPIEQELERIELRDHVQQILWKMSPNYRAVLVLRDIYGFSYEEVASILQISLSSAKIRIYRARLDFRSRYRQLEQIKSKKRREPHAL